MLRDWQLSNPTYWVIAQNCSHCASIMIKAKVMAPPSLFYFILFFLFAGKMPFTPSLLPQLQSPNRRRRRKKNPSIAMPPRKTPVESGDLFSSVGTGLPRTCVLCAWVVNAMGIRMHIIHNKSSRDLHRISSSTF